jgi:hypothetical protein
MREMFVKGLYIFRVIDRSMHATRLSNEGCDWMSNRRIIVIVIIKLLLISLAFVIRGSFLEASLDAFFFFQ